MNSILNKDTESTLFKRNVIKKGKERIDFFTQRDNQDKIIKGRDKQIFNLSIKTLVNFIVLSILNLISGLVIIVVVAIGLLLNVKILLIILNKISLISKS